MDSKGALSGAIVKLNETLTLVTNSLGEANFINQQARKNYTYSIEKDGYTEIRESLFLEIDTTIHISVELSTDIDFIESEGMNIYPNPVKDFLNISMDDPMAEVRLISYDGKTILISEIYEKLNTINFSGIASGVYFLQVKTEVGSGVRKLIIQ